MVHRGCLCIDGAWVSTGTDMRPFVSSILGQSADSECDLSLDLADSMIRLFGVRLGAALRKALCW
eukprot:4340708-Amphidinium_carterae.1